MSTSFLEASSLKASTVESSTRAALPRSTVMRASDRPTLRPVRPTLWRVLRSDGSVAGYIEQVPDAAAAAAGRFEARRLLPSTRLIVPIGDFATVDDALACF